jgi:hypothetical protein
MSLSLTREGLTAHVTRALSIYFYFYRYSHAAVTHSLTAKDTTSSSRGGG